jgi:hypothetical protein
MAFLWLRESQKKEIETGVSSRILCVDCTDNDKIERGCNGGVPWNIGKETYDQCPENLITEDFLMYLDVWSDWKEFGFPFPGDHWTDQPCWVIDSIKIFQEASRSK